MRGYLISGLITVCLASFSFSANAYYSEYCGEWCGDSQPTCNPCYVHHIKHKKTHIVKHYKKHTTCTFEHRAWISGYWENGCWVPGHYAGQRVRAHCGYGCGGCGTNYCCDGYSNGYNDLNTGDDDYPEMQINN